MKLICFFNSNEIHFERERDHPNMPVYNTYNIIASPHTAEKRERERERESVCVCVCVIFDNTIRTVWPCYFFFFYYLYACITYLQFIACFGNIVLFHSHATKAHMN